MKRRSGRPSSSDRVARDPEAESWASDPKVRARMQRQRTRDTGPERALRRLLHARGLRYRVDSQPLPRLRRRADLVFGPAKIAVFVDGCFWHGCPEHGQRTTNANQTYWTEKVARNHARVFRPLTLAVRTTRAKCIRCVGRNTPVDKRAGSAGGAAGGATSDHRTEAATAQAGQSTA